MPIPEILPVPYPPDADYNRQSYEVPGTKRPGQTGAHHNLDPSHMGLIARVYLDFRPLS